VQRVSTVVICF